MGFQRVHQPYDHHHWDYFYERGDLPAPAWVSQKREVFENCENKSKFQVNNLLEHKNQKPNTIKDVIIFLQMHYATGSYILLVSLTGSIGNALLLWAFSWYVITAFKISRGLPYLNIKL